MVAQESDYDADVRACLHDEMGGTSALTIAEAEAEH
jgi:hypothetical protein